MAEIQQSDGFAQIGMKEKISTHLDEGAEEDKNSARVSESSTHEQQREREKERFRLTIQERELENQLEQQRRARELREREAKEQREKKLREREAKEPEADKIALRLLKTEQELERLKRQGSLIGESLCKQKTLDLTSPQEKEHQREQEAKDREAREGEARERREREQREREAKAQEERAQQQLLQRARLQAAREQCQLVDKNRRESEEQLCCERLFPDPGCPSGHNTQEGEDKEIVIKEGVHQLDQVHGKEGPESSKKVDIASRELLAQSKRTKSLPEDLVQVPALSRSSSSRSVLPTTPSLPVKRSCYVMDEVGGELLFPFQLLQGQETPISTASGPRAKEWSGYLLNNMSRRPNPNKAFGDRSVSASKLDPIQKAFTSSHAFCSDLDRSEVQFNPGSGGGGERDGRREYREGGVAVEGRQQEQVGLGTGSCSASEDGCDVETASLQHLFDALAAETLRTLPGQGTDEEPEGGVMEGEVGGGERATLSSQGWKNLISAQTKTNASDAVAVMRYSSDIPATEYRIPQLQQQQHLQPQQEATRKEEEGKQEDTCSSFTFSTHHQEPGGERRDLRGGGGGQGGGGGGAQVAVIIRAYSQELRT